MNLYSKQAVCDWVNHKMEEAHSPRVSLIESFQQLAFTDWFVEELLRPQKIHIPIYTSEWKINVLRKLQDYLYSKEELAVQQWQPKRDLSKIIRPDAWKTYLFETPIAIPEYTIEHSNYWEVKLVHDFMQEDIQFGVRPMSVFRYTIDLGKGSILVDKKRGLLYQLGSFVLEDYIADFENNLGN